MHNPELVTLEDSLHLLFLCVFLCLLLLNNFHHYILLVEKGNMTAPANGVVALYYIHILQVGPGNFFFLDS